MSQLKSLFVIFCSNSDTNVYLRSDYKTMDDFVKKKYHATVSESDEAFVWLIMESYYSSWKNETENKAGARKGFTTTAGKRRKDFEKYVGMVGESRESESSTMWSDKLMEIAQNELFKKQEMENDEVVTEDDNVQVTTDRHNDKERVYLNYAARGLDDSSCDENDNSEDVSYTVRPMTAV